MKRNIIIFAFSLFALSLLTGINSFVFTNIYLPNFYEGDYRLFDIIKTDMIIGYWNWPAGKMLIIMNFIPLITLFYSVIWRRWIMLFVWQLRLWLSIFDKKTGRCNRDGVINLGCEERKDGTWNALSYTTKKTYYRQLFLCALCGLDFCELCVRLTFGKNQVVLVYPGYFCVDAPKIAVAECLFIFFRIFRNL